MSLGPLFRSNDEMKIRNERGQAILAGFQAKGVGTRFDPSPSTDQAWVYTYFNLPDRRQRQALVAIDDVGSCSIYLSAIYEIPEGKTTNDIKIGELPRISQIPADVQNIAEQVVNIACQAAATQEA